ncbi:hypothetical protein ACFVW1_45510 [Streptomyces olivochromogenes]
MKRVAVGCARSGCGLKRACGGDALGDEPPEGEHVAAHEVIVVVGD